MVPKGTTFTIKRVFVIWRNTYSMSMYTIVLSRDGNEYYMDSKAGGKIFSQGTQAVTYEIIPK